MELSIVLGIINLFIAGVAAMGPIIKCIGHIRSSECSGCCKIKVEQEEGLP